MVFGPGRFAMIKLSEAVELAVNGANAPDTKVDGHTFSLRSVRNKNLLDGDETSYFRHVHGGKDDRVFYSVQLQPNKKYTAKITRIQFRGPFVKNGFRPLGDTGIDVTDAVKLAAAAAASAGAGWAVAIPALAAVIKDLDVQGFLDGDWVPAAAKVVDQIGKAMAERS
jgi:hypothetical protein